MNRRYFASLVGLATAFFVSARFAEANALFEKPRQRHVCPQCGGKLVSFTIDSFDVLHTTVGGSECVTTEASKAELRCSNGCAVWSRGSDMVWLLIARSRLMAEAAEVFPTDHVRLFESAPAFRSPRLPMAIKVRRGWHNNTHVMIVGTADEVLAKGDRLEARIRDAAKAAGLL